MSEMLRPSAASTSASVSRADVPQAAASSAATVVLPAPIGPTSTTTGRVTVT